MLGTGSLRDETTLPVDQEASDSRWTFVAVELDVLYVPDCQSARLTRGQPGWQMLPFPSNCSHCKDEMCQNKVSPLKKIRMNSASGSVDTIPPNC